MVDRLLTILRNFETKVVWFGSHILLVKTAREIQFNLIVMMMMLLMGF